MSEMDSKRFGDVLRSERERLGLSIAQANEATRIREQILVAFEQSDMANLPPRGYARNMIGSYSRWLGLDPRKVVALYEENLHDFETQRSFDEDPYSYYGSRPSSSPDRTNRRQSVSSRRSGRPHPSNTSRGPYDTYGADESISQRQGDSSAAVRKRIQQQNRTSPFNQSGKSRRSDRIFSGGDYSKGGARGGGMAKIVIIIVAVALLIVLGIILASFIRSCSSSATSADTPTVTTTPVDETATGQSGTTTTTTTTTKPVTVTFAVADGATSNVTITVDGNVAYDNQDIIGPVQESFTANTQIELKYTSPDSVTLTYTNTDGTILPVTPVVADDGTATASIAIASDGTIVTSGTGTAASTTSTSGSTTTGTTTATTTATTTDTTTDTTTNEG